jgi:glycosidase
MQWDQSEGAGFTKGTPWLKLNPNHKEINVSQALNDTNSIFYTYQKLIALRKSSPYSETIIYGDYKLLLPEDENIFAYTRTLGAETLLIVGNFYEAPQTVRIPEIAGRQAGEIIISNYADPGTSLGEINLRPYEAIVFKLNK